MAGWEALAKEKRESVNALIPKSWLLPTPLPSVSEQRDVTGNYIQQYLTSREIEITETDAVGIVKKTTSGAWKAREVAEAFCHRAALAHQLVYLYYYLAHGRSCPNKLSGKLPPRDFLRRRDCKRPGTRRILY